MVLFGAISIRSAPVLEDEELTQTINRVFGPDYSSLQIVVGRGSKVPIENAAAWALASDCSEDFSDAQTLRSRFDRAFKVAFEDRCAEVLPVFNKYKQRIDEIVEASPGGQGNEDMLKKMALTCRELVKEDRRSEVFNIFASYVERDQLNGKGDTCCAAAGAGGARRRRACFAGKFEVEFDEDEAREASTNNESIFSSIAPSEYSATDEFVPRGYRPGGKTKKER